MARKIEVEIVGDSRSLERAFARSSRSADRFNKQMTGRFTGTVRGFQSMRTGLLAFGGVIGGVALGAKQLVDSASDLNEQINRSRVTFRQSSASIIRWSETTADAIGVSQTAALEATSNFGAMFKTIGLADQQAAGMSRRLTVLGADMASFNNQDPSEMLDRLRSGLSGEAEPLRRFGILLSEARVKQEAYRSGIAKVGAELTEQQKVQARYNLILHDSRLQQGDFARTSEGLANQQRKLRAHFEDLAAKLGTALLPAVTDVVDRFNEWLSDPENQKRVVDDFTAAVEGLATALERTAAAIEWIDKHKGPSLKGLFEKYIEPHMVGRRIQDIGEPIFGEGAPSPEDLAPGRGRPGAPERRPEPPPKKVPPPPPKGLTPNERAARRNQWFDAAIARRLNRLQDLNLRGQLAGLRAIAQTIRARLSVTKDATRRLTLEDQLLDVLREQRAVQEQIGDQVKATNAALQERADAIKAAVLDRLQQRQNKVLNQRALRDAQERLRVARLIGGPLGIRAAREGVQDVQFDILRQRLEAAPARLTKGGQFALGNIVTINIHGVTDPNQVAIKVDEILKKRGRRTSPQTRGTAAGTTAGAR